MSGMDDFDNMARSVLGYYGYEGGWQGGGFTIALITAWEKADLYNREILASAFPVLAEVIVLFQMDDGPEALQLILNSRE